MKKFLPKTLRYYSGFTLVELLVVISIIAVLALVGLALFSGASQKARDSKRVQDIVAMSQAMETQYVTGTGYSTAVTASWFSDNRVPSNQTPGGAAYITLGPTGSGAITTAGYSFCAQLETSVGNATDSTGAGLGTTGGSFYCKRNNQ